MVTPVPQLDVERLRLRVGAFELKEVSLRLESGAYGVLLGPTGCGKTLLAETLCGLNQPGEGRIRIGGRDVTALDPARRGIGYVPQDYALLPFRTVAGNIAFGLEARRLSAEQIGPRIDRLLELLGLTALRDRDVRHLSGGERQRTALGRALAVEPDLLVLDEPLSALDEATGDDLIPKMQQWQRTLKITTLHICHRLEEALALGTMLAVMRDGAIEQAGSTAELAARPVNAFVAEFLRLPNRVRGEVRDTPAGRRFCVGDQALAITECPPGPACGLYPLAAVSVSLTAPPAAPGFQVLTGLIAPNPLAWIKPALAIDGVVRLCLPGVFPPEIWAVGRPVYVRIPETGWYLV